jgi:hypothetical protein
VETLVITLERDHVAGDEPPGMEALWKRLAEAAAWQADE